MNPLKGFNIHLCIALMTRNDAHKYDEKIKAQIHALTLIYPHNTEARDQHMCTHTQRNKWP